MKKRCLSFIAATALGIASVTGLCACGESKPTEIAPGVDTGILDGVELDYSSMFFDGFDGGVNPDNWYVGKQSWGTGGGGNGGVIPENVNYTDDGVLVLTGNGDYYTSGEVKGVGARRDGTLTGGALISKFTVGAGRYEIKMKVLPRLGACSAFWTFAYDNATNGNHEIDIELPGGKSTGNIGFDKALNTNYVTEQNNLSQDVDTPAVSDGATLLNDGKWHTYGFDWYTLEPGENEADRKTDTSIGKVVYYIDGKITAVSDAFVPYYEARLWLGVWFPNTSGFVGDANFETDYMYVDYVSYTPFKNQPIVNFTPVIEANKYAEAHEYPKAPVAVEKVNKVANGSFEFAENGATNSGWVCDTTALVSDGRTYCSFESGIGYGGWSGAKIEDIGLLWQDIDSIYGGFNVNLSFLAHGKGKLTMWFFGRGGALEVGKVEIPVDGEGWKSFSYEGVAPEGTRSVELQFTTETGKTLFVDDVVLEVN